MQNATVTASMTEYCDLNGQAIVYCRLDGVLYVIAKSVVRALSATDYLCGENPYIHRILARLPEATRMLPVAGADLLGMVWDNPGEFKDVYFVQAATLVDDLDTIFPDVSPDRLDAARQVLRAHLMTLEREERAGQSLESGG